MDPITTEQARQDIVDLQLPQIVLDIIDQKQLPQEYDLYFQFPYQVLNQEADWLDDYGEGPITPLWTDCSHYAIVAYYHKVPGFIRFYIEEAFEEPAEILNWQQIVFDELKFLWESEKPVELIRRIAELFDFRHVERLIVELSKKPYESFEEDERWRAAFLLTLA